MRRQRDTLTVGRLLWPCLVLLLTCGFTEASSYLFVWAADVDANDSDFLAVLDADPSSRTYGDLVATVAVGRASGAHHTEHRMAPGGTLFANGFSSGWTFIFNLADPRRPQVITSFRERGPFYYAHSFERLPNGRVLATFQNEGDGNAKSGGIVELDREGTMLRGNSAAVSKEPGLRPYSLAVVPDLDRVVTTGADMRGEVQSSSIQVWRLSDLTLLKTLPLPPGPRGTENLASAEPRVLKDGTVMVSTFRCGLYRVLKLESENPSVELVHAFEWRPKEACSLPVVGENFWVQTVAAREGLVMLDVSAPGDPKEVDYLDLGHDWYPHWISIDGAGERIVATGFNEMDGLVTLIDIDTETGRLSIDRTFGNEGSVDFKRQSWPHGHSGDARPHGSIFSK